MSSFSAYSFYLFPHRPKGNTFLVALRLSIAISAQLDDLLLISLHSPLFRVATAPACPCPRQLANCKEAASTKSCLCSTSSQLLDAWGQTQGQGLKGPRLGGRGSTPLAARDHSVTCAANLLRLTPPSNGENGKAAAKMPRTLTLWKAQKKTEISCTHKKENDDDDDDDAADGDDEDLCRVATGGGR